VCPSFNSFAGVRALKVFFPSCEWHAEWTLVWGQRIRIEEVAVQGWKGDRIIRERFFYDPTPLLAVGQFLKVKTRHK